MKCSDSKLIDVQGAHAQKCPIKESKYVFDISQDTYAEWKVLV